MYRTIERRLPEIMRAIASAPVFVNTGGDFAADLYCRAIPNPYNEPVQMTTVLHEIQRGDASCMIAVTCEANGEGMQPDARIIDGGRTFQSTYVMLESVTA